MGSENTAIIEGEITGQMPVAISPSIGSQAVMLTPSQLRKQMQRDKEIRGVINEYISNNMVAGKDYGTITIKGRDGREHTSKPSLLKPGSEKFCGLFKIRATFRKDIETIQMLGDRPGIIGFICELVDSQGRVVGEGRGTAKADPEGADFDINKQVKIAQKRAQIDAVLRTGGLSDFFTQDMEDAPKDTNGDSQASRSIPLASEKQTALIAKLVKERFEFPSEFDGMAKELTGKVKDWDVSEASVLIDGLFKLDKLDTDGED